jgi:hypothetical protein
VTEEEVEAGKVDAELETIEADAVPTIDAGMAADIRAAIIAGDASEMDRLCLRKFNVFKQLKYDATVGGEIVTETDEGEVLEQSATCLGDSIWKEVYESEAVEAQFWNLVNEKHNTVEEYAAREAATKYAEMASLRLHRRQVVQKLLGVLGMEHSCVGRDEAMLDDATVTAIEPLEEDAYKYFSAKGKARRTKEFGGANAAELVSMVLSVWAGVKVTTSIKKKQVAGKRANHTIMTIDPHIGLWNAITERDYADNIITLVE